MKREPIDKFSMWDLQQKSITKARTQAKKHRYGVLQRDRFFNEQKFYEYVNIRDCTKIYETNDWPEESSESENEFECPDESDPVEPELSMYFEYVSSECPRVKCHGRIYYNDSGDIVCSEGQCKVRVNGLAEFVSLDDFLQNVRVKYVAHDGTGCGWEVYPEVKNGWICLSCENCGFIG